MAVSMGNDEFNRLANKLMRLERLEVAAELAVGLLWMMEGGRRGKLGRCYTELKSAMECDDARMRRCIQRAIEAGFEAEHPVAADYWAGQPK